MTEFYIPVSGTVRLDSGATFRVHRGIHPVPDELANSQEANRYGIKPMSEMTDDEWRLIGMKKPAK